MMQHQVQPDVSVERLLGNMSHEMRRLADIAGELEDLIGDLPLQLVDAPADMLRGLQNMDHLRQSLDALAQVLKNATSIEWTEGTAMLVQSDLRRGVTLERTICACLCGPESGTACEKDRAPPEVHT